jgi:hypothetical protein
MAEIRFSAAVYKVQTLSDGGIRVTLDLAETAIATAAMLMETKQQGIPLIFIASVDETLTKLDDETETKPEKRTSRVGRRRV